MSARAARPCSSASTPKATTSGTRARAAHQTFENIYALPAARRSSRGTASGRPTSITHPVATDPRSAEVLRGLLRAAATARSARTITPGRRRRAAPRTSTRHPYALSLPLDAVRRAARVADRRRSTQAVGVRPVSYRSGPLRVLGRARVVARARGLPRRVERRAAVLRGAQGRTGLRRRAAHAVLPGVRRRDAAGHERPARAAGLGGAQPARARRVVERWYARAPWPYTTKRVLRKLGHRARALAAAVVHSADDMIALARQIVGRAACRAQPALPLERGHRRRQSLQPDAGRARRVLRSARPRPDVRDARAWRRAGDVRRVPRARSPAQPAAQRARRPEQAGMRICHVTPHLPPDQAANALLPADLGGVGARARRRGHARRARAGAGPRGARTLPVGRVVGGCRASRRPRRSAALLRIDTLRQARRIDARARSSRPPTPTPPPAQQRADRRGRGRVGGAGAATRRAHALRHGDLALPAALADRSVHARLPDARRASRSTAAAARARHRARPRSRPACRSSIPPVGAAFAPHDDGDARGRGGRRSASPSRT